MGCVALSVDIPMTVSTFFSIEALAILVDPKIFTSEHSNGNFSEISTNFVAAACITIFGLQYSSASLTELIFVTSKGKSSQFVIIEASLFLFFFFLN